MQVVRYPGDTAPLVEGSLATIGAFDGVHLGHRLVIAQVRRMAEERGVPSAVVTFDRHPASVVRPESAPGLLTDLDQKLDLLAETGVDYTVVVHFDEERSHESAEDFVATVLVGLLRVKVVIVGSDFHFGYQRSGNVALLEKLGAAGVALPGGGRAGFEVAGVDLYDEVGHAGSVAAVSSTRIRGLLRDGDVVGAAGLLGRFHEVRGVVGHGDRRGRELGFPTANVSVPAEIVMPADGVYAGWYVRPDGMRRPAAVSLGRRPTFYEEADLSLLEAYLLDFSGDLYHEAARVSFVAPVREQTRFASVEELKEQMARDVARCRDLLGL
jgi:riboflavin kinase / FMN adenylyltransferase